MSDSDRRDGEAAGDADRHGRAAEHRKINAQEQARRRAGKDGDGQRRDDRKVRRQPLVVHAQDHEVGHHEPREQRHDDQRLAVRHEPLERSPPRARHDAADDHPDRGGDP